MDTLTNSALRLPQSITDRVARTCAGSMQLVHLPAIDTQVTGMRQGAISAFCLSNSCHRFCSFLSIWLLQSPKWFSIWWQCWNQLPLRNLKMNCRDGGKAQCLDSKTYLVVTCLTIVSVWQELITWPLPCTEGVILENVDLLVVMILPADVSIKL